MRTGQLKFTYLVISSLILVRCTISSWSVCLNMVSTESKRTNSILVARLPAARLVCMVVDVPVLPVTAIVGGARWNTGALSALVGWRIIGGAGISVKFTWLVTALLQRNNSASGGGALKRSGLSRRFSSDMMESRYIDDQHSATTTTTNCLSESAPNQSQVRVVHSTCLYVLCSTGFLLVCIRCFCSFVISLRSGFSIPL